MIFNINSTRGQMRFLTCVARVTCQWTIEAIVTQQNSAESGMSPRPETMIAGLCKLGNTVVGKVARRNITMAISNTCFFHETLLYSFSWHYEYQ